MYAQPCLTLCDPLDCSLPGSSVCRIFQARILEWVAISSFRGSSQLRDWTQVSCSSCIGWRILLPLCQLGSPVTQEFKPKTGDRKFSETGFCCQVFRCHHACLQRVSHLLSAIFCYLAGEAIGSLKIGMGLSFSPFNNINNKCYVARYHCALLTHSILTTTCVRGAVTISIFRWGNWA